MSIDLTRRKFISAGTVLVASCTTALSSSKPRPLIGAIRWDAWWKGSPFSDALTLPQWQSRLPWFTNYSSKEICVCGSDPEHLQFESDLARRYSIDYFAFDFFYPIGPDRKYKPELAGMGKSLESFRKLNLSYPKYCHIVSSQVPTYLNEKDLDDLLNRQIDMFSDKNYLRTRDGNPVVYFMMFNENMFFNDEEMSNRFTKYIDKLINLSKNKGMGVPYKIVLNFWPLKLRKIIEKYKFEAASSYGNPRGSSPSGIGRALSFSKCIEGSKYYWRIADDEKVNFIPPLAMGWDFRPLLDKPDDSKRHKSGDYCEEPTSEEISDFVRSSLIQASKSNPSFPSILIYAWNEFTEGGWIAPTKAEGTRRLEAVSRGAKTFSE